MLQHLNVLLVVRDLKLNKVFEVRPYQCWAQGHNPCATPAGHTILDRSNYRLPISLKPLQLWEIIELQTLRMSSPHLHSCPGSRYRQAAWVGLGSVHWIAYRSTILEESFLRPVSSRGLEENPKIQILSIYIEDYLFHILDILIWKAVSFWSNEVVLLSLHIANTACS